MGLGTFTTRSIVTPDRALQRLLDRERARADRSGHVLSLVLFRLHRRRWLGRPDARLLASLRRRARITDEVGLVGRDGAFVILPHTPEPGARRFAESVLQRWRHSHGRLEYDIRVYHPVPIDAKPDDRDSFDDHDPRGHREPAAAPRRAAPAAVNGRARPAPAAERRAPEPLVGVAAADTAATLDPFFARGCPWWKRATDVVVSGAALLALSPILAGITLAIKLDSPGPAVFRQKRTGLGGRPFTILKFRTMVNGAHRKQDELRDQNEVNGPAFKIKEDPRVTRIGKFLRSTSLDELPQLLNVLRGDMTLVGPRPLPCAESEQVTSWQRRRLDVKPGLTCTWQISGRSEIGFEDWMRMDAAYVQGGSFLTDMRILLGTVPAVVARRGAY